MEPGRRDNLFEPVPGDHGSRGRFGAESKSHSLQYLATKHRDWVISTVALAAIGLGRRR